MPTILITGANRGIGFELVKQYAAQGWRVHATCREPAGADALRALAGDVRLHRLDVVRPDEIQEVARALAGEPIDLLVNNAGISANTKTSLGDVDYAHWEHMLRVNVMGPLRVAEAFVPHVAASGRRIMLFLSSRAGSIADNLSGGRYLYRSSKAALNMVVKSLAIDLIPKRITCVAVHPGWARTDMGTAAAPIPVAASVEALRALVDRLEPHYNGHFLNYDGQELRW
ncbi:MAG TPA: SDR family oxidoreductase [Alphaproteobacteria bacterium]|jgi:NAD(P)-dependent dehydrogenase (short-subunit alcohol dehydrogenase family)